METIKQILVIDDEKIQAEALSSKLQQHYQDANIMTAYGEDDIEDAISNRFFNLAILDIRMDDYSKNGIDYAKDIIDKNPFAKIIFVSKFLSEYIDLINPLMGTGRIICFSDKKEYDEWMKELVPYIDDYYQSYGKEDEVNTALIDSYARAKNEIDTYRKGVMFENFVSLLFGSLGFSKINKRVHDRSKNEVDLLIRNDSNDKFLSGFGQYFLAECKNHPNTNIGKNDFILFKSKLDNTNGLSHIGFIFSTSAMAKTTYIEAVRGSQKESKIIFIDNVKMERLLRSKDMLEEFKSIIDEQVKDN